MQYTCPKCRCGSLFEDHGKMVCMNCGAECSKLAAQNNRHVHSYETYSGQRPNLSGREMQSERPKTYSQPAFNSSRTKTSAPAANHSTSTQAGNKKQSGGIGCIFGVLIFVLYMIIMLVLD